MWFEANEVNVLDFPAQSLNLNIVKNIWAFIQFYLKAYIQSLKKIKLEKYRW